MFLRLGSNTFEHVKIPLLWGQRAVIGHPSGDLSVIDLSSGEACIEIVAGTPAEGIEFSDMEDGFVIYRDGDARYFFSPARRLIRDLVGPLPECEIGTDQVRVGGIMFSRVHVRGFPVGISVGENAVNVGASLPNELAPMVV